MTGSLGLRRSHSGFRKWRFRNWDVGVGGLIGVEALGFIGVHVLGIGILAEGSGRRR